jgi:hypothetical protein
MRKLLVVLAVLSLVVLVPGCSSTGSLFGPGAESGPDPQLIKHYEQVKADLEGLKTTATAEIARAQATADANLEAKARETLATVQKAQTKLATVEDSIRLNKDGSLDVGSTAAGAAALLPPPWNVLAIVGLPIVVGGIQEFRKRRADQNAKSIVNSIDVLMQDAIVKSSLKGVNEQVKKDAHAQLTEQAKKLIESESVT